MFPRIRDLREDSDTTQESLAKILRVSQSMYSSYERKNSIPTDILLALARYYHTSVDYLLGLTDVREPYPSKSGEPRGNL